MPNNIVSVRMPDSLMQELKIVAKEEHFMDLSEAVRHILKQKASAKLQNKTQDFAGTSKEELLRGLQILINQLQHESEE